MPHKPLRSTRLAPRLLGFLLGLCLAYAAEAAPNATVWIAAHAKPATGLTAFGVRSCGADGVGHEIV